MWKQHGHAQTEHTAAVWSPQQRRLPSEHGKNQFYTKLWKKDNLNTHTQGQSWMSFTHTHIAAEGQTYTQRDTHS